jgi:hypothetical protein
LPQGILVRDVILTFHCRKRCFVGNVALLRLSNAFPDISEQLIKPLAHSHKAAPRPTLYLRLQAYNFKKKTSENGKNAWILAVVAQREHVGSCYGAGASMLPTSLFRVSTLHNFLFDTIVSS